MVRIQAYLPNNATMTFSLVIPCYNEAPNLPLLLERCKALASTPGIEVILVDNGSTDSSAEILTNLLPHYPGCRSIRVDTNQGYGYGILAGLKVAHGDTLGWTHADMQTDPQDALHAFELFKTYGPDTLIKGLRNGRPFVDVFFTLGMSIFESLLLSQPMRDINAQPTVFSRTFFKSWTSPPHDFSLDLYAYYQAKKSEQSIHRFQVHFGDRAHGVSHWNVNWSSKIKFILRTVRYSIQLRKTL